MTRNPLALAVLVLFMLVASACQPRVELVRPVSGLPAVPAATVTPAPHNVAIVGVDFDPPLTAELLPDSGITLLVAVENKGLNVEPQVAVSARLLDPAGEQSYGDLLRETVVEQALEPGDVRIVRFTEVTDLPPRSRYQLIVELAPVDGEADLEDNLRTYDVLLGSGE